MSDKVIEILKEIEAWLSFNTHPSREQIADFRKDLKLKIKALTSKEECYLKHGEGCLMDDKCYCASPPPEEGISVFTTRIKGRYAVKFQKGVQSFTLDGYGTTQKEAEWMADILRKFFKKALTERRK